MKQKIMVFDGASLTGEPVEAPGRLRWAAWSPAGGSALLVGDRGAAVVYRAGSFEGLRTHSKQNLRSAEFTPGGGSAYICGNRGTVLVTDLASCDAVHGDARENLRRLAVSARGEVILVGNDGAAYALLDGRLERVHGAETNLRSIAWRPGGSYALVSGNCFRASVGGLTPSPNLFRYEDGQLSELSSIPESRADLTVASWRPGTLQCLLAGYDQTWHTPVLQAYGEDARADVPWGDDHIFPTACAWHPSGEYALVGTGLMRTGEGDCAIYRYDGAGIRKLFDLGRSGVSCISWSSDGRALILASSSVRAFSV